MNCVFCKYPGTNMQIVESTDDNVILRIASIGEVIDERDKAITELHGRMCAVCTELWKAVKRKPSLVEAQKVFVAQIRRDRKIKTVLLDGLEGLLS
jgi:hypothetical protein